MDAIKYGVIISDNYDYINEEAPKLPIAEYDTYEEAEAHCKRIIDESLQEGYSPDKTADELFSSWGGAGLSAYVIEPGQFRFNASNYAKARCKELGK